MLVIPKENLKVEYPGRGIIIGKTRTHLIVGYFITARSEENQARRLKHYAGENKIMVDPTKPELLEREDAPLVFYPAITIKKDRIAVSNGQQTRTVEQHLTQHETPAEILRHAHRKWRFEPDKPHYTPRISGVVVGTQAALAIIRRGKAGNALRKTYPLKLQTGVAQFITTYEGHEATPLPAFKGGPKNIALVGGGQKTIADSIFRALNPNYRVSLAVVFRNLKTGETAVEIRNRHQ